MRRVQTARRREGNPDDGRLRIRGFLLPATPTRW
jgi:hypothetical protein